MPEPAFQQHDGFAFTQRRKLMFEPLTRKFVARWDRIVTIRKLQALDDRILADLGVERHDIARFVSRVQCL
jgi:uncharacterized protein YjiS (DUF1127 family)